MQFPGGGLPFAISVMLHCNLANLDTSGTVETVLINGVSSFQGFAFYYTFSVAQDDDLTY